MVSLRKRIGRAETQQQEPHSVHGTRGDRWHPTHDRVWLGESFWANPIEDWRVVDGGAEVQTGGGDRNVHLITHRLTAEEGFPMSVRCRRVENGKQDGGAGFRIGIPHLNDHRSNCFARGIGVDAGLVRGRLTLGEANAEAGNGDAVAADRIVLPLEGRTEDGDCELRLTTRTAAGTALSTVRHTLPAAVIEGNVAIVSNFDREIPTGQGARYWFSEWTADGDAFESNEDRRFGPIPWSMYSMSDSRADEGYVAKLTALAPPLGEGGDRRVELLTERGGEWRSHGFAGLDSDA